LCQNWNNVAGLTRDFCRRGGVTPPVHEIKKKPRLRQHSGQIDLCGSILFGNFAGFDAACANPYSHWNTLNLGPDALKIDIKAPQGKIVGLADTVSHAGFFSAYFANLCHRSSRSKRQYMD
jgi:hypothetical protein